MDYSRALVRLLLLTTMLLGCGRSPKRVEMPAGEQAEPKPVDSAQFPEPQSAEEALQVMQEMLHSSVVDNNRMEPTPADVEATIVFGKAQLERFPQDENLPQALAAMMFQSIRFLQKQPDALMKRRMEVGKLAREILSQGNLSEESKRSLSFHLLEEAKSLLQQTQSEGSWKSIVESRDLGFDQSKLFYLDQVFAPIMQQPEYASKIEAWLQADIDKNIARQEGFPVELSLQSLDEADATIALEDFADKQLILIDLWGTWCGPCRAAIPHLVELQEKFADQVAIVGITFEQPIGSVSLADTKARVDEYRKLQTIPYPCGLGDFDPRSVIPGFKGFPTMLLIDKQGRTRLQLSGYHPLPVLETAIHRVLASM